MRRRWQGRYSPPLNHVLFSERGLLIAVSSEDGHTTVRQLRPLHHDIIPSVSDPQLGLDLKFPSTTTSAALGGGGEKGTLITGGVDGYLRWIQLQNGGCTASTAFAYTDPRGEENTVLHHAGGIQLLVASTASRLVAAARGR
jgi:hypothetical protein